MFYVHALISVCALIGIASIPKTYNVKCPNLYYSSYSVVFNLGRTKTRTGPNSRTHTNHTF